MVNVKQVSNDFGIRLVAEEEVPEPARDTDRSADLWKAAKTILVSVPGQWAAVKVYVGNVAGAGQKASSINNGKSKSFPADHWQARSSKDETSSTLYLRYVKESISESPLSE